MRLAKGDHKKVNSSASNFSPSMRIQSNWTVGRRNNKMTSLGHLIPKVVRNSISPPLGQLVKYGSEARSLTKQTITKLSS